jgi:DedD protein
VRLNASIQAPGRAGQYTLEVTLVQEAVAWFPEMDGDKLSLPVRIAQGAREEPQPSGQPLRTAQRAPEESKKSVPDGKPAAPVREARKAAEPTVEKAETKAAAKVKEPPPEQGQGAQIWTVQAAAFPERREAESFAKRLQDKNYDAYIVVFQVKGKDWYRVRVGRVASRADAEKLQTALRNTESLPQAFVTQFQ